MVSISVCFIYQVLHLEMSFSTQQAISLKNGFLLSISMIKNTSDYLKNIKYIRFLLIHQANRYNKTIISSFFFDLMILLSDFTPL